MNPIEQLIQVIDMNIYVFDNSSKYLCRDGEYNFLGLMCQVYVDRVGDISTRYKDGMKSFDGKFEVMPNKVKEWYGLTDSHISYISSEKCNKKIFIAYLKLTMAFINWNKALES